MTKLTQAAAILVGLCLASMHLAIAQGASPEQLKELLKKADDWSVPQPKTGAKPVKVWVYQSGTKESGTTDFYALGFVPPGDAKHALVGFDDWDLTDRTKTVPVTDLEKLSLADIAATSPFSSPNGVNFGLVTGIQLLRRGNEKIGAALINQSLGKDSGHPRSMFYSPAGEAPVLMLARSCLAAAVNDITSPKPDFAKIKQRIERLVADQPRLKESAEAILDALKENVEHKQPPAGSIERIVDDYLVGGGTCGAMTFDFGQTSAPERALVLQGFKAVPALLRERNSSRFSNHLMQLIEGLEPPRDAPAEILQSFQDIYDHFRNDATVRNVSSSGKFSGPSAGFPHDKIEMRDFIHRHWSRWLKLDVPAPEQGATQAQWKVYREAVERGIDRKGTTHESH